MASALFIPRHVQCPSAWLRHRRHDDFRGTWPLNRGASQVVPNLRMEKCAESLRGGELMGKFDNAAFVELAWKNERNINKSPQRGNGILPITWRRGDLQKLSKDT